MRRGLIAAAVVALVAASLWYVVAPPRGQDAYGNRAAETTQTLRSQVLTAALWADAVAADETLGASAKIGLEDAELRAEGAASTFSAYDPPPESDELHSAFGTLAGETTDLLAALRIAAHREEWETVAAARPDLERLAARLDELTTRARRQ